MVNYYRKNTFGTAIVNTVITAITLACIISLLILIVVYQSNGFFVKPVEISNFPTNQDVTVSNSVDIGTCGSNCTVTVGNFPDPVPCNCTVSDPVTVGNFPTNQDVTVTTPIDIGTCGSNCTVTVDNFPEPQNITVEFPANQDVTVTNFPSSQDVTVSNLPATQKTMISGPLTAFGSVLTESYTAIFQTDAVYGFNTEQVLVTTSGSGTATAPDSIYLMQTGTTIYSYSVVQSKKRLRYRSGQGSRGMFSAMFTPGITNAYQVVGIGHSEDGVYFGYDTSATFGILHSNRGVRETRTLTITTASTTAENVVVTLNAVATNVAVTNTGFGGIIQRTVFEISQGNYPGWRASPLGATIVFVRDSAGPASGSYSLTASTAVGTFAQTKAGIVSTNTWVPQAQWNGDSLNGTGPTGVTLDPSKLNVFQISMQYLGAGAIRFFVEVLPQNENTEVYYNVHTMHFPNSRTTTTFGNPSFPFTATAYSAGSVSNVTVGVGSFAGFIEGERKFTGDRFAVTRTLTGVVDSAVFHTLFTIHNDIYFGNRAAQGIIHIMSINAALQDTQPLIVYAFRSSPTQQQMLVGNPDFQPFATNAAFTYDIAATSLIATNAQLIWAGAIGRDGNIEIDFGSNTQEEITLQPGDYFSLCARTVSGTANAVVGSVTVRQDY